MIPYGRPASVLARATSRYIAARRIQRGWKASSAYLARRAVSGFITNRWARQGAARLIQRGFRKYKARRSRAANQITVARVNSPAYENLNSQGMTLGFLDIETLNMPQHGIGTDKRKTTTVMLSGIKYCWQFSHAVKGSASGVYPNIPYAVHFALVQVKSPNQGEGEWDEEGLRNYISSSFFRLQLGSDGEQAQLDPDGRTRAFNNYEANSLFDFGKNCLPIAKDKLNVLFHKKFTLNPRYSVGIAEGYARATRFFDGYIKINKPFAFYGIDDRLGKNPFVFCSWANTLFRSDHPTAINTTQVVVNFDYKTKVYFKNM